MCCSLHVRPVALHSIVAKPTTPIVVATALREFACAFAAAHSDALVKHVAVGLAKLRLQPLLENQDAVVEHVQFVAMSLFPQHAKCQSSSDRHGTQPQVLQLWTLQPDHP